MCSHGDSPRAHVLANYPNRDVTARHGSGNAARGVTTKPPSPAYARTARGMTTIHALSQHRVHKQQRWSTYLSTAYQKPMIHRTTVAHSSTNHKCGCDPTSSTYNHAAAPAHNAPMMKYVTACRMLVIVANGAARGPRWQCWHHAAVTMIIANCYKCARASPHCCCTHRSQT